MGAEAPVFVAPAPAPPKEAMTAGLLVLPWYQDQIRMAARSVSASIPQDRATSASSRRVGLGMRHAPVSRRPTQRRAGRLVARGHREPRPASFPEGYFIRRPPDRSRSLCPRALRRALPHD